MLRTYISKELPFRKGTGAGLAGSVPFARGYVRVSENDCGFNQLDIAGINENDRHPLMFSCVSALGYSRIIYHRWM